MVGVFFDGKEDMMGKQMMVEILIALVMNLATYIMVSTISNASAEKTQNYFKDQLDKQDQNTKEMPLQLQQNFMNETATNKVDLMSQMKDDKGEIMSQIKESSDKIIKEISEKIRKDDI